MFSVLAACLILTHTALAGINVEIKRDGAPLQLQEIVGGYVVPPDIDHFTLTVTLDDGPANYEIATPGFPSVFQHRNTITRTDQNVVTHEVRVPPATGPIHHQRLTVRKTTDLGQTYSVLYNRSFWFLTTAPNYGDVITVNDLGADSSPRKIEFLLQTPPELDAVWAHTSFEIVRLGGIGTDGTVQAEGVHYTPAPHVALQGEMTFTWTPRDAMPGEYEARLKLRDALVASTSFTLSPPPPFAQQVTWQMEEPDPGLMRDVTLSPDGPMSLGDALRANIQWTDDEGVPWDGDVKVPDYVANALSEEELAFWKQSQGDFENFQAGAIVRSSAPHACVADDPARQADIQIIDLEATANGLGQFTIDTVPRETGVQNLVIFGSDERRNARLEDQGDRSVLILPNVARVLPFTVRPPLTPGLLTMTRDLENDPGLITVGFSRPFPDGFAALAARAHNMRMPVLQVVRLAMTLPDGTHHPEKTIASHPLLETPGPNFTAELRLSDPLYAYELRLVGNYPCAGRSCYSTVLDQLDVPSYHSGTSEDRAAAELLISRIAVPSASAAIDQPWPPRTYPVYECLEPPVPTEPEDYVAPAYLGLEVATYPEAPVPGAPLTVTMRFQNTSDRAITGARARITLYDPAKDIPPPELAAIGTQCTDTGGGVFDCDLGDMPDGGLSDVTFRTETPMSGAVIWTAELSAFDMLGGLQDRGGVLGQRAPPRIVDIVVPEQSGWTNGVPRFPYPFANDGIDFGELRDLLIIGHNLPQGSPETLSLKDDQGIDYALVAYPDTTIGGPRAQNLMNRLLAEFYGMDDPAQARARAEADGYDLILVSAKLRENVLPGLKTLTLTNQMDQTASGYWPLEFSDLWAELSFVRQLPEGPVEQIDEIYLPERVFVAVELSKALPIDTLPIVLSGSALSQGAGSLQLTALRSDHPGGRLYLAGPIDPHGATDPPSLTGGTPIPVTKATNRPPLLEAKVDETFLFTSLRLPVMPLATSARVVATPASAGQSWLFKDALRRAVACHEPGPGGANLVSAHREPIEIDNWNTLSARESDRISNLMLLLGDDFIVKTEVAFGHHAMMILLRDLFVQELSERRLRLDWIRGNPVATLGFLRSMSSLAGSGQQAILRMPVAWPDGTQTQFRLAILNDLDWYAETLRQSQPETLAWQKRATQEAIANLLEVTAETLTQARAAGDCNIEELLRVTGAGFGPISDKLKARMMTLAESGGGRTKLWVPDDQARLWIDRVAPLAAAVRAQTRAADTDTSVILAIGAMASVALGLAETPYLAYGIFAFEALDAGYSLYDAYMQISDSKTEIAFSSGASVVIGEARYDAAMAEAQTWVSQGLSVGSSIFGAASTAIGDLPRLTTLRRIARGRALMNTVDSVTDITRLGPTDLGDFGTFAAHARARSQIDGITLSTRERRAIDLVESLYNRPKPPEPVDGDALTLVESRVADPYATNAPVGFDPDPSNPSLGVPRRANAAEREYRSPPPLSLDGRPVRFGTDTKGAEIEYELGERLGVGSTSVTYADPNDPTRAIRITFLSESSPAALADRFGENVLRNKITSPHLRPVRVYNDHEIAEGMFFGRRISRVTIVERLDGHAWDRFGGTTDANMKIAEIVAIDGALTDLNKAGFVWLDNKGNNFDVVRRNDGSGRAEVVIMDAGGIYRVQPGAHADFGLDSDAELARQIQLMVNGRYEDAVPDWAHVKNPVTRVVFRRDRLLNRYGDVLVFDGKVPGVEGQLHFNARSGEDFPKVQRLFMAED